MRLNVLGSLGYHSSLESEFVIFDRMHREEMETRD